MPLINKLRRGLLKSRWTRKKILKLIALIVLFGLMRNLIELYKYGAYWQNVKSIPPDAFDQPMTVLSEQRYLMRKLTKIIRKDRNETDDELKKIISDLMFRREFLPKENVFDGDSKEHHSTEFEYLSEVFEKRKKGVFVEIGAQETTSIERGWFLGRKWDIFVVEPSLEKLDAIIASTNNTINGLNSCISTKSYLVNVDSWWRIFKLGHTYLPCFTPNSLFAAFRLRFIDFLSFDAAGDELRVLKSVDFSLVRVWLVRVRQLVYEKRRDWVIKLLLKKGFTFERQINADMFFVNSDKANRNWD